MDIFLIILLIAAFVWITISIVSKKSDSNSDRSLSFEEKKFNEFLEIFNSIKDDVEMEYGIKKDVYIDILPRYSKKALEEFESLFEKSEVWINWFEPKREKYDVEYLNSKIGTIDEIYLEDLLIFQERDHKIQSFVSKITKVGNEVFIAVDIYYYGKKLSEEATLSYYEAKNLARKMEEVILNYEKQMKKYEKEADNYRVLEDSLNEKKAIEKMIKFRDALNDAFDEYEEHLKLYRIRSEL